MRIAVAISSVPLVGKEKLALYVMDAGVIILEVVYSFALLLDMLLTRRRICAVRLHRATVKPQCVVVKRVSYKSSSNSSVLSAWAASCHAW